MIIVVCMITWNAAWGLGLDIRQEWIIVRSRQQCETVAWKRGNSARASDYVYDTNSQSDKKRLDSTCGPGLKDCIDYREK